MSPAALELRACTADPVDPAGFNPHAALPYGLETEHLRRAMGDFVDFLTFINTQLHGRGTERLESFLMPANFSSIVGEYMNTTIPKYCPTLVKNRYHNGHPDLLPAGMFPGDAIRHHTEGIEVKGSRYLKGWQGHNEEQVWLLVFCFASNRPVDPSKGIDPLPFRFVLVCGAELGPGDMKFSGRKGASRRTITASVTPAGYAKMMANWIYRLPGGGDGADQLSLLDGEEEAEGSAAPVAGSAPPRTPPRRARPRRGPRGAG